MIYTVTLNPSIDLIVRVKHLDWNETNRAYADEKFPGGKGIMVSRVLKNLGCESINTGFIGGFTGRFICDAIAQMDIPEEFIEVEEDSRINIKLKAEGETEINTPGPFISEEKQQVFLDFFSHMTSADFVVLSGSLPKGLSTTFYEQIIQILVKNNVPFSIDTTGQMLIDSFSYRPFLIKPNIRELEEIFQTEISSKEKALFYAKKCVEKGCQNVLVSMGKDGAIFTNGKESYYAAAIKQKVINSVGAGDSMVAGFVAYRQTCTKQAFQMACACAAATTFSEDIGTKEKIDIMYHSICVERM